MVDLAVAINCSYLRVKTEKLKGTLSQCPIKQFCCLWHTVIKQTVKQP